MLNYIIPPILGGIIALSTNWLAIKMLFRPHKAKYIFGLRIPFTPGLIPKERTRLTGKMAEAISTRLLTPDVLATELSDPALWPLPDITVGEALESWGIKDITPAANSIKTMADKLLPNILDKIHLFEGSILDAKLADLTYKVIDENLSTLASIFVSKEKIYTSIKNNLKAYLTAPQNYDEINSQIHTAIDGLIPMAQDLLNEKIFDINIKEWLTLHLKKETTVKMLSIIASYIAKNMPIQAMIENKLNSFDVAEAEDLILTVAGRELRLIIWLGGILGFIIGSLTLIL